MSGPDTGSDISRYDSDIVDTILISVDADSDISRTLAASS